MRQYRGAPAKGAVEGGAAPLADFARKGEAAEGSLSRCGRSNRPGVRSRADPISSDAIWAALWAAATAFPFAVSECQGSTSRCAVLGMAPGLKHSGEGACGTRSRSRRQAVGSATATAAAPPPAPLLAVACLNGDKGPRGESLDYPLGIAWRRTVSIRSTASAASAWRRDEDFACSWSTCTIERKRRSPASDTIASASRTARSAAAGSRCQGLGDDVEAGSGRPSSRPAGAQRRPARAWASCVTFSDPGGTDVLDLVAGSPARYVLPILAMAWREASARAGSTSAPPAWTWHRSFRAASRADHAHHAQLIAVALVFVGTFVLSALDSITAMTLVLNGLAAPWVVVILVGLFAAASARKSAGLQSAAARWALLVRWRWLPS